MRALAIASLLACREPAAPEPPPLPVVARDPSAAFQTDSLAYTLRATDIGYEGRVEVAFTNPRGEAVYFVNCNRFLTHRLQKQEADGSWTEAWNPGSPGCLSEPVVVAPGETLRDTVHIAGARPGQNIQPEFRAVPVPGVYRLVWSSPVTAVDRFGRAAGPPLPLEQRVSNPFTLDVRGR